MSVLWLNQKLANIEQGEKNLYISIYDNFFFPQIVHLPPRAGFDIASWNSLSCAFNPYQGDLGVRIHSL